MSPRDYSRQCFVRKADQWLEIIRQCSTLDIARERLYAKASEQQYESFRNDNDPSDLTLFIIRNGARALRSLINERSDRRSYFSFVQVLRDIAQGHEQSDLQFSKNLTIGYLCPFCRNRQSFYSVKEAQRLNAFHPQVQYCRHWEVNSISC
jgi:hypothetical protein